MQFTKQFLRTVGRNHGVRHQSSVSFEEIRIPVPWGHIAGKWWGPQDKRPILTMHGWQDNCGSFDLLIPQLPKHLSYLTIDFPGHGLSTRLPPGTFYHGINGVISVRQIKDYFKWDTISLMGHSLGAITAYSYGFLYPETVDFMVCIDGLQPLINPRRIERVRTTIEEFLKYDKQNSDVREPPSYTIEEMSQKLHIGTRKSIDLDKTKYILERNILPSKEHPGKYFFNRDPRLKCGPLINWAPEDLYEAAKGVTFPLFVSIAEKTPFFSNEKYYTVTFENLKVASKDFELHRVKGAHHGHLNSPEVVVDVVTKFIEKHDKTDRSIESVIADIRA